MPETASAPSVASTSVPAEMVTPASPLNTVKQSPVLSATVLPA